MILCRFGAATVILQLVHCQWDHCFHTGRRHLVRYHGCITTFDLWRIFRLDWFRCEHTKLGFRSLQFNVTFLQLREMDGHANVSIGLGPNVIYENQIITWNRKSSISSFALSNFLIKYILDLVACSNLCVSACKRNKIENKISISKNASGCHFVQ